MLGVRLLVARRRRILTTSVNEEGAQCALTIITPLLNRAAMLPDALASIAAQASPNLEHIVVDGGSTDGSQKIAIAAGAALIEAPGSSIYEAINLGIKSARGAYIWLLNSDDCLAPGAVATALAALREDPTLDFVRGRAAVEARVGDGWRSADDGSHQAPSPTLRAVLLGASNINACAFRTAFMRKIGPFDTTLRIASDREWLARAMLAGAQTRGLDQVLYVYRAHDSSLTIGGARPSASAWVDEHLSFAKRLLADRALPARARADIRAFFAKETAHLTALSLSQGKIGDACSAITRGFAQDMLWPAHALGPLAAIASRRLTQQ